MGRDAYIMTISPDSWAGRVLRAHAEFPRRYTDDEVGHRLAQRHGMPVFQACDMAHKRRAQLYRMGLVRRTKEQRNSLRGRPMTVWELTADGEAIIERWNGHASGPNGSL